MVNEPAIPAIYKQVCYYTNFF